MTTLEAILWANLILRAVTLLPMTVSEVAGAIKQINNDETTPTTADDISVAAKAFADVVAQAAEALKNAPTS